MINVIISIVHIVHHSVLTQDSLHNLEKNIIKVKKEEKSFICIKV